MTNCIVTQHEWKDLKVLQESGISLSTPSNEAAKMFDALIAQLIGWYNDESLGGISGTIKRMKEADADYVLGPLLEILFRLSIQRPEKSPELQASLNKMEDLLKKKTISPWEMKQVDAIRCYAKGYPSKSVDIWEELVRTNPHDMFSLRMAYFISFFLGYKPRMKAILEGVMPSWTPAMALYGYVQGMYAFALNESNCHKEAEKYAVKALEINRRDCWSTHARVHVMEETNRAEEGKAFMEKTEQNWTTGALLSFHNYWHLALFYLDKADFESALTIFDDHILSQCSPESVFPLTDGASLLYRLQLEGVPAGERWHKLNSYWCPSQHTSAFIDVHEMMNHLGAKDYDSADALLESCNEFIRQGKGTNWEVTKEVGISLCEAMVAFDKELYDDAVELLSPVREDVVKIGGSGAQSYANNEDKWTNNVQEMMDLGLISGGGMGTGRDVFNLLLIHAAIRSSQHKHRQYGTKLLRERKELLGETGVTHRLEEKLFKRLGKS